MLKKLWIENRMRTSKDVNDAGGREKELEAVGISIFSEDHDGYTTKKSAESDWI
jgi:hypothetical protein